MAPRLLGAVGECRTNGEDIPPVEAGATARHAWAIVAETEDGVQAEPGMYSVVADVSARVGDIYLPGAIRTLEVLAGE